MSITRKIKQAFTGKAAKRAGILVFLFFLIKGLIWVAVAVGIWLGLSD